MQGSAERVAVIVLAAGASRRFGVADKLLEPLGGRPLAAHAFALAGACAAGAAIAVTARDGVADLARAAGLVSVSVPPGGDQSASVRAGLAALPAQVDAVLFMLADMPWLRAEDLAALLDLGAPACARDGAVRMPPALLPRAWCEAAALSGDSGLRPLLARIAPDRCLDRPSGRLRDVDRPSDLFPAQG